MKRRFYFLVRHWKSPSYLKRCLNSILSQSFSNFSILFIDDASIEDLELKRWVKSKLKRHVCIFNDVQRFSLQNAYEAIHSFVDEKEAVIINVDGDDWLLSPDVIERIAYEYKSTECILTFGNCQYYAPKTPNHLKVVTSIQPTLNQRFSKEVEETRSYRHTPFIPLHLRTWKADAFKKIKKNDFLRPDKTWIKFCEDQAIFYPLLENSEGRYSVINEVLYSYNIDNPLNDAKIHSSERLFDEVWIKRMRINGDLP